MPVPVLLRLAVPVTVTVTVTVKLTVTMIVVLAGSVVHAATSSGIQPELPVRLPLHSDCQCQWQLPVAQWQ
jgi:hypothetical protein